MDLYIDRDALSRGLGRVQNIVERRSTKPIHAHVLLHAANGMLRLTATDSQVAYIGDIEANVESPGDLTVDAASFFQIAKALPEATVRLAIATGNRLEITCGRAFFRLPGAPASEYPALPAFDESGRASVTEAVLHRVVNQSAFAVSADDNRYGINGAYVQAVDHADGPRLRMVGTDGHRLAAAEGPYEGSVAITERKLISRKALAVIKRLLDPNSEDPVELVFGEGSLKVSKPGHTFWFRLIDGEFPPYERVLPDGVAKHRMRIRKEELAASIRRVGILVHERVRAVKFAFEGSELVIHAYSVDRGEVTESLPIELEGEAVTAGFNARYLGDVLDVVFGEYVTLELAHALAACVIRDPDRDDGFFVVMPMRLD